MMRETVTEQNALHHCNVLYKVVMNAALFSSFATGIPKTRWTVGEMAGVFDAAWGHGQWPYSSLDILRILKTLRTMGLIQIESGIFGRIKAYSLSDESKQTLLSELRALAESGREDIPDEQRAYCEFIDNAVVRAQQQGEEVLYGMMAIAVYENAIKSVLKNNPGREMGEKVARDLITAGGNPPCVITGLANALSEETDTHKIYTRSAMHIHKEWEETRSVDEMFSRLRDLVRPKE